MANSRSLTNNEEQVTVTHIIELAGRGEPPRLAAVTDMANSLRKERDLALVGSRWASTFVSRQEELKVVFNRKYDYKRALCEDPKVIQGWFRLVENTKAKYGILDDDTYSFDETGFMMGQISTGAVVTASEQRGRAKQVQPGNREWVTVIEGINATGWAIPPTSSSKPANTSPTGTKTTTSPKIGLLLSLRTAGLPTSLVLPG
jgi:hypothetical protein